MCGVIVATGFPGSNFQKMAVVLTSPRITVSWWGTNLIQKFQAKKMCSTWPFGSMSTTIWFLVVDGGSGLWIISVYGTPFPTGTADQANFYLCEAAITIVSVSRLSSQCSSPCKESGKTIARDKPVSTFECTRKHFEHGYNVTTIIMYWNILWSWR